MDVLSGFRGDDLEDGAGGYSDGQRAEDVATGDGGGVHRALPLGNSDFNIEDTEKDGEEKARAHPSQKARRMGHPGEESTGIIGCLSWLLRGGVRRRARKG